jgi:hypothetical protein
MDRRRWWWEEEERLGADSQLSSHLRTYIRHQLLRAELLEFTSTAVSCVSTASRDKRMKSEAAERILLSLS